MNNPFIYTNVKFTLLSLLILGLIGCGGGNKSERAESTPNADEIQRLGEIVIANQGDKLTVDGWFFDATIIASEAQNVAPMAKIIWELGVEQCKFSDATYSIAADGMLSITPASASLYDAPLTSQLGAKWREAYSAGDSITIDSRAGNYATLKQQTFGSSISYATDARWIRDALPEDAALSIPGSDRFPAIESLALTSVPLLKSITPESKTVMPSENITWQPNATGSSEIVLTLTENSTTGTPTTPWIQCTIIDDGIFSLPTELMAAIQPTSTPLNFTLRRVSETTVQVEDAILLVKQIDYPL